MKVLKNKNAIVTGASGGIGKQIAIGFAKNGANVAICARNKDNLERTAALCRAEGVKVLAIPCDVSDKAQLISFIDSVKEIFDTVDILVNNAVSSDSMIPFIEQTEESLDKAMKSGVYATWNMMQLCFPLMKENGGSIINFGSSSSNGQAGLSSYGCAKAAICALTRAVAVEWGQYNIRVNNLKPFALTENMRQMPPEILEFFETNMHNTTALHRVGTPEDDVVPVVIFLASDASRWITGQDFKAEGGLDIHE